VPRAMNINTKTAVNVRIVVKCRAAQNVATSQNAPWTTSARNPAASALGGASMFHMCNPTGPALYID